MAELPPGARVLAIGDVHLGDGGPSDMFGSPRRDGALAEFLDAVTPRFDAAVLCGDVIDSTQARGRDRIASAHPAALAALRRLARRVPTYLALGNHDRPADVRALLPEVRLTGAVRASGALFAHGHQLDLHWGGQLAGRRRDLGQRVHRALENALRVRIRLPFAEHDNWANRAGHWVFYRHTMATGRVARVAGRLGARSRLLKWAAAYDYWSRSQWGDPCGLLVPVAALLAAPEAPRTLVLGHAHQGGVVDLAGRTPRPDVSGAPAVRWRAYEVPQATRGVYVNVGSWALGDTCWADLHDGRAEVRRWPEDTPLGEGAYGFALSTVVPGLADWWRRYYRGLLRYDRAALRLDWERVAGWGTAGSRAGRRPAR